jgi:DNA-binding SARP family transcriptional activator
MPTLQIRLFGDFQLLYNGELITTLNQARLQSLLAYLVLHRDAPQSRQRLAFLFWPDTSEAQARANLRRALYDLRQILPNLEDFLRIDSQALQWRPDVPFEVDVAVFEHLLVQAMQTNQSSAGQAALEQAVTRYTGDLLPACYEDWVLHERERLRQRYLNALEQLVHLLEDKREYQAAIAHAQRLLQADPLQESSYRTLMRLHVQIGDRARALRVYHTCVTILQQELGVSPGPETEAAHQHLLHLEALPTTEPAPAQKGELPLVGRGREWAALQSAWRMAVRGQPSFVLVAGEAGIGKTRLAEELLQWADRQGYITAKTRSYAAEGQLAYAPITDWLRTEGIRMQVAQMERIWLGEVARRLPELLIERPDLSPPQPLADSWQRQRFREALARALVGSKQLLLLVIDDLQWCDQETLEWLHYLLRFATQARLLIVGTVRLEEVEEGHALLSLTRNLRQEGKLLEIELGRLDAPETAALAAQVAGHELDDDQSAALYAETEGYPLFVVEMMRARQAGEQVIEATGTPAAGAPPKVQAVIQSRLAQLSPPSRALASLAAIVGRAFTVEVLAQARPEGTRGDEDALVGALDELWQRRIIREQGEHAYDFSHDKIREAAQAALSPARRRLLHRRVAQALEQVHTANLDAVSGQIAGHYDLAGLAENAVLFYQRAATVAQQVYAHAEATHHLNKGLALLRQLPVTPEHLRQELRLQFALGISLTVERDMSEPEVREAYVRAQQLAAQVGDDQDRLVAAAGLHISELTGGQMPAAYELAVQGLSLAERIGDPSGLVEAQGRMGTVLLLLGQWRASRGHLEQALAQPEYRWDSASLLLWPHHQGVIVRRNLAFVLWHLGYPDQAQEQINQALAVAQEIAHPYTLVKALSPSAWLYFHRREPAFAQAQGEKAMALARQQGFRDWRAEGIVYAGWALVQQGQVETGLAHIREGLATNPEHTIYLSILAEVYGQAGQPAQGLPLLAQVLDDIAVTGGRFLEAELHRLKGELLWMQDADEQAVETQLLQALAIARQQEAKSLELRAAMSLGRLWQRQEKRRQARDLLAEVYGWFSEGFDTPDLQQASALLEALS